MGGAAARLLGRVRAGRKSRRVEPPICDDLKSWATSRPDAVYTPLMPPITGTRPPPKTVEPEVDPGFASLFSIAVPERALVRIPGARLRGRPGLVILPTGEFVGETVAVTAAGRRLMLKAEPAYFTPLPSVTHHKSGSFYPLLGFGHNNYYHLTHDVVMRFLSVEDHLPADVQLVIAEETPEFGIDVMRFAGLDKYPWVQLPPDEVWELETLYVANPLIKTQFDTAEHFAPYRAIALERHGAKVADATAKIYITRRDDRYWRALNEPDVERFLVSKGFTVVSPKQLSVSDQIELFSRATVIVGTGAGMTNAIFARPGAKILQLQEASHVTHPFWTMATALGFDYAYLLCDIVPNPGEAAVDITVPIDKLEAALALLGEE